MLPGTATIPIPCVRAISAPWSKLPLPSSNLRIGIEMVPQGPRLRTAVHQNLGPRIATDGSNCRPSSSLSPNRMWSSLDGDSGEFPADGLNHFQQPQRVHFAQSGSVGIVKTRIWQLLPTLRADAVGLACSLRSRGRSHRTRYCSRALTGCAVRNSPALCAGLTTGERYRRISASGQPRRPCRRTGRIGPSSLHAQIRRVCG